MRSRLLSITSTLALILAGTLLALAPAGPANAHCSGHGSPSDMYTGGAFQFQSAGTPIRAYPHDACALVGLGYPAHGIDVHCMTNTGGYWLYLRNTTTGVKGWARLNDLVYSDTTIAAC